MKRIYATCVFLGVLLVLVTAQQCPDAERCIKDYVTDAQLKGYKREQFCRLVWDAIDCLKRAKPYCERGKPQEWVDNEIWTQEQRHPMCGCSSLAGSLILCTVLSVLALFYK